MRSNYNPSSDGFNTFSIVDRLNALNISHSRASKPVIPFVEVAKSLKLPEHFKIGSSRDNGGCFFDCIAQSLNAIHNTNEYNEKSLRLACFEFYSQRTALVDKWNDMDAHGGKYHGNYSFIQYTEAELDCMTGNIAPTWGRPNVEGRMLCEFLQIKQILMIEVIKIQIDDEHEEYQPVFSVCTAEGVHEIYDESSIKYDENTPILMNVSGDLHFNPILPVKMTNTLAMQKEETKSALMNEAGKEKAVIVNETPKKSVATTALVDNGMPEKSVPKKAVIQNATSVNVPEKMLFTEKAENGEDITHEIQPQKAVGLVELLQDLDQQYVIQRRKETQYSSYHALYGKNNLFEKSVESESAEAIRESAITIAIEGLKSLGELDKRAVLGHAFGMMIFGDELSIAQLSSMLDDAPCNNAINLKF